LSLVLVCWFSILYNGKQDLCHTAQTNFIAWKLYFILLSFLCFHIWQAKAYSSWSFHWRKLEENLLPMQWEWNRDEGVSSFHAMTDIRCIIIKKKNQWDVFWLSSIIRLMFLIFVCYIHHRIGYSWITICTIHFNLFNLL
jgi:hypothetical protein